MRMRKKKNGAARLSACAHLLCTKPESPIATAAADFHRTGELHLEVGCGKGGFICEMAKRHPAVNFYAMERVHDVMVLAAERAARAAGERPDNLRFILGGAAELGEYFAPGSITCLYLNFSDPWPKKGYAKRRLTHRNFLLLYFSLLAEGGEWRFKSDNAALFAFTLEELAALGLVPYFVSEDFHSTPEAADNVMTEYETNFSEKGMPIYAVRVKKPCGWVAPTAL